MRVKLDENVPWRIAPALRDLGHDVDSVESEGLQGEPDVRVCAAAFEDARAIVTFDLDYGPLALQGRAPWVVILRLSDTEPGFVLSRLVDGLDAVGTSEPRLVVVGDQRLRVRRPPAN